MPSYLYRAEDGSELHVFARMADAPPIGHKLKSGGKRYTRVLGMGEGVAAKRTVEPFASESLPLWAPGAKRYDKQGRPVFRSRSEAQDFCKKSNDTPGFKRDYHWNP